jgi:hypothetical protein
MLPYEQIFVYVPANVVSLRKNTIETDDIIQERTTKNILYFPYAPTLPQYNMWMKSPWYWQNQNIPIMSNFDVSQITFGFAERQAPGTGKENTSWKGQDIPLVQFSKVQAIHRNYRLYWDIDFSRSYFRVLDVGSLITPLPFIIPLYFEVERKGILG